MTALNLIETREGIYLPKDTARKVLDRLTTQILNHKLYKSQINKLFYLLDDLFCYGVVKLKSTDKVVVNTLSSDSFEYGEVKKRWPNKEILFSYELDVINLFSEPKKIELNDFSDTLIKEFEYSNGNEELIKDINAYDPKKQTNEILVNDWKIALALYSTKKTGTKLNYSTEDIVNLAEKIYQEITHRVSRGEMSYDFKSESLNSDNKEQKLTGTCPFIPMVAKNKFYQVDDAINFMFEIGQKYAIEKKFEGYRCLLVKNNDNVDIYSSDGINITNNFDEIKEEIKQLSSKDIILDCQMDEHAKIFNVFDIIEFGEDLSDKVWNERKQILHSLNFTRHINEVSSIMVDNETEAKKVITLFKNLKGSEGVMIKRYDGTYAKDDETDEWITFSNQCSGIENSEKYTPPESAKNNAQKVIDWKEKYGDEVKGMTNVGWTRARQLASGKPISIDIVKRMAQFNRHRKNAEVAPEYKNTPWRDAGYVAWLGWGGTTGIDWAISISSSKDLEATTTDSLGISKLQGKKLKGIKQKE